MIDLVPETHLRHLIRTLVPAANREDAERRFAAGGRADVLALLETSERGIGERLLETWSYAGARSVQLWRSHPMAELGPDKALRRIRNALANPLPKGETVLFPAPREALRDRVSRARTDAPVLRATVRVTIPRSVPTDTEDGSETVLSFTPVDLRADLRTGLIEVYGGPTHGRRALKAILRTMFDDLPAEGSREWTRRWMTPIAFSEKQVAGFAEHHHMAFVNVRGPDPAEEFGAVEYDARVESGREIAFAHEKRIEQQLREDNDHRTYAWTFTHPDAYEEALRVRFVLAGQSSHLTFVTRTSDPAMRSLIDSLVLALGT